MNEREFNNMNILCVLKEEWPIDTLMEKVLVLKKLQRRHTKLTVILLKRQTGLGSSFLLVGGKTNIGGKFGFKIEI